MREQVPAGARVAEFYAGVGAIGLSVLPRVSRLRLIEISPQSVQGLALGLEALAPVDLNKIEVIAGSAGTMASAALGADVVIADPPRKGTDRELLHNAWSPIRPDDSCT